MAGLLAAHMQDCMPWSGSTGPLLVLLLLQVLRVLSMHACSKVQSEYPHVHCMPAADATALEQQTCCLLGQCVLMQQALTVL